VSAVTAQVAVLLAAPGQPGIPMVASLSYDAADPYAVRVAFHVGLDAAVEWIFARDILAGGAAGSRQGIGDVRVWPSGAGGTQASFCIGLSSPSGDAVFEAPAAEVGDFLRRAYQLVPEGSEDVDVDAGLEDLLRTGGDLC
jgi:hypothetical protein